MNIEAELKMNKTAFSLRNSPQMETVQNPHPNKSFQPTANASAEFGRYA
jgi:hypothetical protein